MTMEELEALCREAARSLVEREGRPLPAAVVIPQQEATRVVSLPDFPGDDQGRTAFLERYAQEVMRPANASCYGFLAEGTAEGDVEVIVLVYGARRHHPHVTAAPLDGATVGDFLASEELAPAAMPFVAPLQQAVEDSTPPDVTAG